MQRTICLLCIATVVLSSQTSAVAEPTVEEVRVAALRYAGLHKTDRWSARARWRHLLPRVHASVGLLDQSDDKLRFDEYLSRDGNASLIFDGSHNQNETSSRNKVDYSIGLTVDLRGLVFDTAELPAAREARQRVEARLELIERVHTTYFERLAALDELSRAESPTAESRLQIVREVEQLEARLDGLTGGWFCTQHGVRP